MYIIPTSKAEILNDQINSMSSLSQSGHVYKKIPFHTGDMGSFLTMVPNLHLQNQSLPSCPGQTSFIRACAECTMGVVHWATPKC